MRNLAVIIVISSYFFSVQLSAKVLMNFSKVIFYLDDKKRTDSFTLRNGGSDDVNCGISLAHYTVTNDGIISRVKEGLEGVYNPANKLVRYSPRSVNIPTRSSQSVRISFRRVPKLADGEYISYLRVQCKKSKYGIDLMEGGANLSYHLPVIVRYGNVNLDSQIISAKLMEQYEKPYVEIKHERMADATGSVIGDYEVIGTQSGKSYGIVRNIKVYAPAKFGVTNLNLSEKPTEPLQVKFTIHPEMGELTLIQDVITK